MRKIAAFIATFGAVIASPALADPVNPGSQCVETPANAEGFALARGIVGVILPPDQQDQMMRQLLVTFDGQLRAGLLATPESKDPKLQAILDKFQASVPERVMPVVTKHMPAIKEAMACAYTHNFSLEELRSISQFALSPAGQHYLHTSLEMIGDPAVASANNDYMKDLKGLMQAMQAELMQELVDYGATKKTPARSKSRH